jgi:hypothetical protein
MTNEDWPRMAAGRKKNDNGQLPLSHPKIEFLVDKNHRVRTYAKYYFELSHTKKAKSTCTNNDAQRMKRNLSTTPSPFHYFRGQPKLSLNTISIITSFVTNGARGRSGGKKKGFLRH